MLTRNDGAYLAGIRLLVLDFDGVMTDNRVLVDQNGNEAVWCHRGDGWGLARLKESGVKIVVISTEKNPVVGARCKKLGIGCVQGCDNKLDALKELANECDIKSSEIVYVGNDVNDLDCMKWVGMPIAVADAEDEVLAVSRLTTSRKGGWGAVRQVADWILDAQHKIANRLQANG